MMYLIVGLVGAILAGVFASKKNRSVPGWAVLGGLLPLAFLVLLVLKPLGTPPEPET